MTGVEQVIQDDARPGKLQDSFLDCQRSFVSGGGREILASPGPAWRDAGRP